MSSAGRAANVTAGRRRASTPQNEPRPLDSREAVSGKSRSKGRRPRAISLAPPGFDLAGRLQAFQQTLRRRVEHRDTLVDIVRAVNTTLDPVRVADILVERAATWIPAPCWALVFSDDAGQLSVVAERGLDPAMRTAVHQIARSVINRGEDFVTADLSQDVRVTERVAAAALAFPLVSRGRRVGALVGLDAKPSSREPRLSEVVARALRTLVEPAAVALDNALRLRRAEALSVTDDLTRLYNSRFLNLVLRRETKRATRSVRPLSLLFIDLDGFKTVNDRHGHLAGSRALVEAAAVIRGSARETDVVARFGGDEFALVLPDTGAEGAYAVGERIRERIAAHRFLAGDGLGLQLTASIGVATLPDVAVSAEELVQAADTAMYRVKDRGKNGIEAAAPPADK